MKPGSLEALQSLVHQQNSHTSIHAKPQIYEKELTD